MRVGRKRLTGVVVSDKMEKTVVVRVGRLVKHSLYSRVMRRARKFKVHDPLSQAHTGDEVLIEESRPISKDKRWRFVSVVRKGIGFVREKEASRVEELKAVGAIRKKQKPPAPAAQTSGGESVASAESPREVAG